MNDRKKSQSYKECVQECVLSPLLFNVYLQSLPNDALEDDQDRSVVNLEYINNFRYTDDIVQPLTNAEGLHRLVDRVPNTSRIYKMRLNNSKNKS